MSDDSDRKMVKLPGSNKTIPVARSRDPDFVAPVPRGMPLPEDEPMATAVVARGRTVCAPTGKRLAGYDPVDGRPLFFYAETRFGPGEEVRLPISEIARLTKFKLGFLHDPNRYAFAEQAARRRSPSRRRTRRGDEGETTSGPPRPF